MDKKLIDGVVVRRLHPIPDDRGWLMELFRSDWEEFERFGQLYITVCYPGIVKGWHYHKKQTDNFVCIKGMAKVVLYDSRESSVTRGLINEFFMGERNFIIVKIPPNVYHGFTAIGGDEAWVLNIPTEVYDYINPDEHRLPFDSKEIPYDWAPKNR
ncbi:MAG: dTDP-4-dehydrorhamnose 3,5-epimerase family protein [Methanomassiliicoccales archaeon]